MFMEISLPKALSFGISLVTFVYLSTLDGLKGKRMFFCLSNSKSLKIANNTFEFTSGFPCLLNSVALYIEKYH